jgi:DNA-directed RNA polymerase subunit RPC12/RpoP
MNETIAERRSICPDCGGELADAAYQSTMTCPACGARRVAYAGTFQAERMLPFSTSTAQAREAALRWIRRAWLAPGKVARLVRADAMKDVYLPFWMFDAHAIGPEACAESWRWTLEI